MTDAQCENLNAKVAIYTPEGRYKEWEEYLEIKFQQLVQHSTIMSIQMD